MRLGVGRPIARIGEIKAPVRPERQIVGPVELHAVGFGDQDFDFAAGAGLLDRRRTVDGRGPSSNIGSLRGIDATVASEHAGVWSTADIGVGACLPGLRVPHPDRARVGVGVDDPAVVEFVWTLGVPEAARTDSDWLLHRLLPFVHQVTSPPVKFIACPVM